MLSVMFNRICLFRFHPEKMQIVEQEAVVQNERLQGGLLIGLVDIAELIE